MTQQIIEQVKSEKQIEKERKAAEREAKKAAVIREQNTLWCAWNGPNGLLERTVRFCVKYNSPEDQVRSELGSVDREQILRMCSGKSGESFKQYLLEFKTN